MSVSCGRGHRDRNCLSKRKRRFAHIDVAGSHSRSQTYSQTCPRNLFALACRLIPRWRLAMRSPWKCLASQYPSIQPKTTQCSRLNMDVFVTNLGSSPCCKCTDCGLCWLCVSLDLLPSMLRKGLLLHSHSLQLSSQKSCYSRFRAHALRHWRGKGSAKQTETESPCLNNLRVLF